MDGAARSWPQFMMNLLLYTSEADEGVVVTAAAAYPTHRIKTRPCQFIDEPCFNPPRFTPNIHPELRSSFANADDNNNNNNDMLSVVRHNIYVCSIMCRKDNILWTKIKIGPECAMKLVLVLVHGLLRGTAIYWWSCLLLLTAVGNGIIIIIIADKLFRVLSRK